MFQLGSRILVKMVGPPPPPPVERVEWQFCSFECLKLHSEGLQSRTLDVEWGFFKP
jgi:hypothetical protein